MREGVSLLEGDLRAAVVYELGIDSSGTVLMEFVEVLRRISSSEEGACGEGGVIS